jgi:predicted ribosomally synthesized peptide with nif11-like leader
MSIEKVKEFYVKVMKDQELFNKIGQIPKDNPGGVEAGIVKIAAQNKYDFTVGEMKTFLELEAKKGAADGELSDSELEAVAGGKSGREIFNWIAVSIGTVGIGCAISGIVNADGDSHTVCTTGDTQ